jgi:nuclear pore complex protein Nup188
MFVLENALYLTMSQGMLYLKDPSVHPREKQLLKRELGTEMVIYILSKKKKDF